MRDVNGNLRNFRSASNRRRDVCCVFAETVYYASQLITNPAKKPDSYAVRMLNIQEFEPRTEAFYWLLILDEDNTAKAAENLFRDPSYKM